MANEMIELYKTWTEKKVKYPVGVQQKFDGVPGKFINVGGNIVTYSRQGEQYLSTAHIERHAQAILLTLGGSFTGELYVPGLPFKDIGGLVRRQEPAPIIQCYVFDFDIRNTPQEQWIVRHRQFALALAAYLSASGLSPADCPIKLVPTVVCNDANAVGNVWDTVRLAFPKAEGLVGHSLSKPYQPGTRRWDTQKLKPRPSIELRVVGFKEALSADGDALGMVGRVECELTTVNKLGQASTGVIGVGPGSLTHAERRSLWKFYTMVARDISLMPKAMVGAAIAEVGYMPDPSYDMLREPTFKRWRLDRSDTETYQRDGE